jgi:hypothetical protein
MRGENAKGHGLTALSRAWGSELGCSARQPKRPKARRLYQGGEVEGCSIVLAALELRKKGLAIEVLMVRTK